jgi:hypothetical protein
VRGVRDSGKERMRGAALGYGCVARAGLGPTSAKERADAELYPTQAESELEWGTRR